MFIWIYHIREGGLGPGRGGQLLQEQQTAPLSCCPLGLYFRVCCALQDSTHCSPGHVGIHCTALGKVPALGETQCVNSAREGVQWLPAYLCHHHSSGQNQHLCSARP